MLSPADDKLLAESAKNIRLKSAGSSANFLDSQVGDDAGLPAIDTSPGRAWCDRGVIASSPPIRDAERAGSVALGRNSLSRFGAVAFGSDPGTRRKPLVGSGAGAF
jgi:hypothetical protein